MPRILGVGIATLDLIHQVERFPAEDEEMRALSLRRARGGNATNTLVVLSQLGHYCAWAGMLPREPDGDWVARDLREQGIDLGPVVRPDRGKLPHSCILLSRASGSRTIVHYRDLPEYPASAFEKLDLEPYHWIHFEGRAVAELGPMLERARHSGATISLEVEKPREGIEALFSRAHLLLFSRAYAYSRGFRQPESFLESVAPAGIPAYLAWGEAGGWCRDAQGIIHRVQAPMIEVVDSIGAGDVFNAGVIHATLQGRAPAAVLESAVKLASAKCRQEGLQGLAEVHRG